MRSTE